jgi:L-lactate dehydrogenase complex protein LldF
MSEYKQFQKASAVKAADEIHRLKILKAVTTYEEQLIAMKSSQFLDWQSARNKAAEIRDYSLNHLPDLLEQFEKTIIQRGAQVLWAATVEEAQSQFLRIAKTHHAKKVIKSKSMLTEEIELNKTCEMNGLNVLESDLGELIVQFAGEKPYHIVTPAMHKSTQEISILFHEKLGIPLTEDAGELTMAARRFLRQAYIEADLGVTGANFLLADEGAISITENEGNARLSLSCPPVHVVITGIEKIIPRLADLSLFLPLLATSGTGQQITCYNTVIRGPRQAGEADGPQHLYIILLDNNRSRVYAEDSMREALRCIRCGSCLNSCPVYRTIGGHTYHTTYQGPIGSVITPYLKDMKEWRHLPYASSLCGACTDVCPVEIDLHQLLLDNRHQSFNKKLNGWTWTRGFKFWSGIFKRRPTVNLVHRIGHYVIPLLKRLLPRNKQKRIPDIPKYTFSELWDKNEQ